MEAPVWDWVLAARALASLYKRCFSASAGSQADGPDRESLVLIGLVGVLLPFEDGTEEFDWELAECSS